MDITKNQAQSIQKKLEETILVVKREFLFSNGPWEGMRTGNFPHYLKIINSKKEFLPRHEMEQDEHYKQIIPYLVFTHNSKLFVMQRSDTSSETRLNGRHSLGIGGHIRQEDMKHGDIFEWANREFHEEVEYLDTMTIEPLGVLNDDSNAVGKVHMGFVFLIHGHTPNIRIKSELKSGELMSYDECITLRPQLETWSQIVLDVLLKKQQL